MARSLVINARRWVYEMLGPAYMYSILPSEDQNREVLPTSEKDDDGSSTARQHSWLWGILPWVIASPLGKTNRRLPKTSSTTYVNGMRGVACFIVYHQHLSWDHAKWIHFPYGMDEDNMRILQMPFFRVLHAGKFMVAMFFVLSGFVLSYSPLKKMNNPPSAANDSALLTSLASSLFRRPLRLFLPMAAAIILSSVIIWYHPDIEGGNWRDENTTFPQMFWNFWRICYPEVNPYSWGYHRPTGFSHGWTLQMEYRGSIVVYLLCLTACKLKPNLRKIFIIFSAWWSLHWGRWEVFCFIEGMLIAELRLCPIQWPNLSKLLPASAGKSLHMTIVKTSFWCGLLAFGLLAAGWPMWQADTASPWREMYYITPAAWTSHSENDPDESQSYWNSLGAAFILVSIEHLPRVQNFFNTRPMVYLGEISYAFYLMHQNILFSVGHWWYDMVKARGWSDLAGFFSEYIFVVIVLITVADLFWRGIDEKVVKGSRILARWCGM